jgi:Pyridoxamine 5'-phosphate oxidase
MSVFTAEERDYLVSGVRLGRLATVGPDGMPHVVPTAFRYNRSWTPEAPSWDRALRQRCSGSRPSAS